MRASAVTTWLEQHDKEVLTVAIAVDRERRVMDRRHCENARERVRSVLQKEVVRAYHS